MKNKNIQILKNGNICSPLGFQASGVNAGLKKSGKNDMALIYSDCSATAACVFTSSKFQAAPVLVCKQQLKNNNKFRAVIVNSGVANACTAEQGLRNSQKMVELTAKELNLKYEDVFVSSTGRIGTHLPMDLITKGIEKAVKALDVNGGKSAAEAIMTTDTRSKEIAVLVKASDGAVFTIAGIAKGAGMIAPNMKMPHATMLSYITTDADVEKLFLEKCLEEVNENSFNKITVDGDMSTNDTVIILANSASKNNLITENSPDAELFHQALYVVMAKLAKDIVKDGEGITKFVTVQVKNAASLKDAKLASRAISESLLCKTAWFGCDPNWGRVLGALGYSGAEFNPSDINLHYEGVPVVLNGVDAGTEEGELSKLMQSGKFTITINLNAGVFEHEMWTNDISYEYVKINAEYHT